jgi:hypothetical protein
MRFLVNASDCGVVDVNSSRLGTPAVVVSVTRFIENASDCGVVDDNSSRRVTLGVVY